ncbi:MAG: thiosulfate oxidation carrier protein SoxY [Sterolibacterium sp.]|nr:thiosulfate oxidation carrier protein SoxY [Sterolibacterium sp.]
MNLMRRVFLGRFGSVGALTIAMASGLLKPVKALAAEWNKAAFDATVLADSLKSVGGVSATESKDILINAPDNAENGAVVQLEATSKIPGTTSILILIEKNPRPLLADFEFSNNAEPYVFLVAKMAESSRIRVLAKAGGKTYFASKQVNVTTSGC